MADTTWSREWKAKIIQQKTLLRWNYTDLARASGLGVSQVRKYVSGHYTNDSPRIPIERALERALKNEVKR